MPSDYPVYFLNEFTEGTVTTEKGRMIVTPYNNLPFPQNGDPKCFRVIRQISNGHVSATAVSSDPLNVSLTSSLVRFLANHANGRATGTVLHPSVVVVCDVCIVAKRCAS